MDKLIKVNILDFDDIRNPLLNAGQARSTYEVAKRLVKRGVGVTVVSSKYPGYTDRIENGIKYNHIGITTNNIKLNNIIYILSLPFAVMRIKCDLIVECMTPPISTLLTPLFTKIPVVLLPSMFNAEEFSKKYHLPFHLIEKAGMKLYRHMMPYSDTDFAKARKMNPKIHGRKIAQGVAREYFKIAHKKPKHILFLGRLDMAQKGIDLLLESYAKVKNQIGYPLVIAGHGPDESKINRLINELGLNDQVKLIGPVYNSIKNMLISESLFVAFPSRHDEMSLWSLEALASGMPLAIFDLPEFSWAENKIVFKAKAYSTDSYAKILIKTGRAANNPDLRKACRNFAKKYSWEDVAREYKTYFTDILKEKRIHN